MFIISISFHCFMHFSVVQLWCTNFFLLFLYTKIHTALKRITKVTKQKISKFFFFGFSLARREKKAEENVVKVSLSLHEFFFLPFFFFLEKSFQNTQNKITKKKFLRFLTDRTEKNDFFSFTICRKFSSMHYFIYFFHQLYFLIF